MLNAAYQSRGLTLIELLVTLTLAAIMMSLGAPAFSTWLQNVRIRTTAESVIAGLNYAKSEATTRNAQVRFQFTTTLGADCQLSADGTNWVVDLVDTASANDSVAGRCDTPPSDTVQPGILQTRGSQEGSGTTTTAANASNVVFNGLGRLAPAPNAAVTVDIGNNTNSGCQADGGHLSCLRILISPAGQVRMCNPRFPAGDPQAC